MTARTNGKGAFGRKRLFGKQDEYTDARVGAPAA